MSTTHKLEIVNCVFHAVWLPLRPVVWHSSSISFGFHGFNFYQNRTFLFSCIFNTLSTWVLKWSWGGQLVKLLVKYLTNKPKHRTHWPHQWRNATKVPSPMPTVLVLGIRHRAC
jgi:hypothetical protein